MTVQFERDMEKLHGRILSMFGAVEEAIHRAVGGLHAKNGDIVKELLDRDREIDRQDIEIEEACLKILTLHQPVARDLRRVTTVFKIIGELERVADLAVNISERAAGIADFPDAKIPSDLREMSRISLNMLHRSIDAFVALNVNVARQVCDDDDKVDRLNDEAIRELQSRMVEDSDQIIPLMHLFSATRHIERVADHATNIAEGVVYMVSGEIIRHGNDGTDWTATSGGS